jgi:hypothetical protein
MPYKKLGKSLVSVKSWIIVEKVIVPDVVCIIMLLQKMEIFLKATHSY